MARPPSRRSARPARALAHAHRVGHTLSMATKKRRVPIPKSLAARVMFDSDRCCCICRERGKSVQIHHIDEDPSNNAYSNLSALCFDCHELTQISGGFGRKLDADQVTLYRDDWHAYILDQRRAAIAITDRASAVSESLELATSLADIFRENEEWVQLATHYHSVGNTELRDKYITKCLEDPHLDGVTHIYLRGLQRRGELVPDSVANQVLDRLSEVEDWAQRARALQNLGRYKESVVDYMKSVAHDLEKGNAFSAAYYLKELSEKRLFEELFLSTLDYEDDLWWQYRALQELGWRDECRKFCIENEARIREEGNPFLMVQLELAVGDIAAFKARRKRLASNTRSDGPVLVIYSDEESSDDETTEGVDWHPSGSIE